MFDRKHKENSGVSPVIGVILMVAVTVALVALVTLVVFDIGGNTSEPADISLNTEVEQDNSSIFVEVVRNENVDILTADGDVNNTVEVVSSEEVGTTRVGLSGTSGTVELQAEVGDNEEIVQTVNYDFS